MFLIFDFIIKKKKLVRLYEQNKMRKQKYQQIQHACKIYAKFLNIVLMKRVVRELI